MFNYLLQNYNQQFSLITINQVAIFHDGLSAVQALCRHVVVCWCIAVSFSFLSLIRHDPNVLFYLKFISTVIFQIKYLMATELRFILNSTSIINLAC